MSDIKDVPTPFVDYVKREIKPIMSRANEQGQTLELTHNKLELIESRLASNDKNIAMLAGNLEQMQKIPPVPERAEIYAALAKAQASIKNAAEDAEADAGSYKYQYATLSSVLDAVRGPLSENGIALFQVTADQDDGRFGIKTVLAHESGQIITDLITMHPEKSDPRGIGSIRTYMRRYAVLAICGIAGANDDDAEGAQKGADEYERITDKEVDSIIFLADELFGDISDKVVEKMLARIFNGAAFVGDIKAGEAQVAINHLKQASKTAKAKAKKGAGKQESPKPPEQEEREPGSDDDK